MKVSPPDPPVSTSFPRSSDELVVATTPIQGVVACTAHQKVVVPPSGDTIVAHPGIEVIGIV